MKVLPFQMKDGFTLWTGGASGPLTLEMIERAYEALVNYVPPTTEEILRAACSPEMFEMYMKMLRAPRLRLL